MGPGFSSIFIPSRVVGEVWRREGWTLYFPVFILSLAVDEVWRTAGFPYIFFYIYPFLFWMKYGGRKVGSWIFLYIILSWVMVEA